jgi:probable rRNA maturation factor
MLEFENIEISINQKQEKEISHLPFLQLKNDILGRDYSLSISFVTPKVAQSLNKKHRGMTYVPNTLSFPYSESSGEAILQLETIYSQAPEFEMDKRTYLLFILIHSLLHLKGHDHGGKMDKLEQKYLSKYSLQARK